MTALPNDGTISKNMGEFMNSPVTVEEKRITDALTGCYARGYILPKLEEMVEQKKPFTLFVIDLNKFKNINDLQGHNVGDIVLQEIGSRLCRLTRDSLIFSRIGGDEFLAVYLGTDAETINKLGEDTHNAIQEKIIHDNFEYEMSASIGVARFPDDGDSLNELLSLADSAMYYAKNNNLRGHCLVTDDISQKMARKQQIKRLLKTIDYEKDLDLRFQPQFDLTNGEVIGIESIVQWNHKEEGVIHRSEFVPVAEEMGVVQYVTKWLFLNSLAQIKEWNEKYNRNLSIAINVSQSCIYHKIFFTNVSKMVEAYGIQKKWLAISLNEHSIMHAPEYMKTLIAGLNQMGIPISIHNFGSGMISIGQIKQLFIDYLKIGPEIVGKCTTDTDSFQTLRGIIMLAKGMELQTIANGVENKKQCDILVELGCNTAQGNYLEKPMTADEFEQKYLP